MLEGLSKVHRLTSIAWRECLTLLWVSTFVFPGASLAADDWWDAAWKYRQRVTIEAASIEEDLKNFPLRLCLEDGEFARTRARADGADLRVVGAGGTPLPHEVVAWGINEVKLYALIPEIQAAAAGQSVHLYFGNPEAGAIPARRLWDERYGMVLHVSGDLEDSTGTPLPVRRERFVVQNGWTAGLIMHESFPWVSFDRNYKGFLDVNARVLEELGPDLTVLCRFRAREKGKRTLFFGQGATPEDSFTWAVDSPRGRFEVTTGGGGEPHYLQTEGVKLGQWQSLVFSYQSGAGVRTICLDGTLVESRGAAFPMKLESLQIGSGPGDSNESQFHGDVEEVRLLSGVYSQARMRAEAINLSEARPLVALGPLEAFGQPSSPPAPPELLRPLDRTQSHSSAGIRLEWLPAVGAETYAVHVYKDAEGKQLLRSVPAGPATSMALAPDVAPGSTVFWSVVAQSKQGETRAQALRRLTFYRWGPTPSAADRPRGKTGTGSVSERRPQLIAARDAQFDLKGYLGVRIDNIAKDLAQVPGRNPGMLRMLCDRPQKVIPWSGIYAGQYLSSSQLIWRLTRDEALKARIDSFVREWIACQREDGYLGPFDNLTGYVSLWNHNAALYGLLLHYEDTGYGPALEAARKIADLVIQTYGPEGKTVVKAGGANESISNTIAILYRLTGEQRYLDMANYFVHEVANEAAGVRYFINGLGRKTVEDFPARRWESIPNIQTLAELYWVTGDEDYRQAFENLWWTLLGSERHNTGGFSTNEGLLGTPYNPGTIETCCTLAWLLLSIDMLKLSGDSRVADELEWSTLNSALGSVPYDGSCSTYATQSNGDRQYCVLQQGPPEGDGPELNCCSTNANRGPGMIANWALMEGARGLVLNFYGPSTLWATLPGGNRVQLEQVTEYPARRGLALKVSPERPEEFTLNLRIPKWSRKTVVKVNGKSGPQPVAGTYLSLRRQWREGDQVDITFDFTPRFWAGEQEESGRISIYRGPILCTYEARFNDGNPDALPPIEWKGITVEPRSLEGETHAWVLAEVTQGDRPSFKVCDFASAGLTGKRYRSWFATKDLPPSPFQLKKPDEGERGKNVTWEKRAGAESWTLIVSKNRDLSGGQHIEGLEEPRAELAPRAPSRYYWTVIAHNENGATEASNGPLEMLVE